MQTVKSFISSDTQRALAREHRDSKAGRVAHFRGVIEFTNICHHNCLYCGMRVANKTLNRYVLDKDKINELADRTAVNGIKTLMIQGGDHLEYDISQLCHVVSTIRERSAQTILLCLGDRDIKDYEALFAAGATQAIIKFETSNRRIYRQMRPHSWLEKRLELITALANIGYQMSSGFILGLPGTTRDDVEKDLELTSNLPVFAASVSPYIPNDQSPLATTTMPLLDQVLDCIAQLRIRNPKLWIPSVSALNLLAKVEGYEDSGQFLGLMAGANVLTVNYTPSAQQESYVIYTSKRNIVEIEYAKQIANLAGLDTDLIEPTPSELKLTDYSV